MWYFLIRLCQRVGRYLGANMRQVYGSEDGTVYLDHTGVVHETEKAILYKTATGDLWVPKSVIEDDGEDIVGVKRWWASANKIKGDW